MGQKCRFLLKSVKNICIIQLKSVILQRKKVLKSVKVYVVPQDFGIFGGVSAFGE